MEIPPEVQDALDKLRVQTKPTVSDPRLERVVNELFRDNPTLHPEGTASAIIYETKTGNLVGGKTHKQKGEERMRQLEKMIQGGYLNAEDQTIATDILEDLRYALLVT
ncbi:hypothetical protein [Phormidium nigroviride]